MEKVNMSLSDKINKELEENYLESLKDEEFAKLVKRNKIPRDVAIKNNSSLLDTCGEIKNCKNCKGLFMCKNKVSGYVLYPSFDATLKFIYMPCKYQKNNEALLKEKREKLDVIGNARMRDIDILDKNRVEVIKWLKNFYDNYTPVNTLKGLYLHGSFGSGKTFLLAALLNELKINKNASIEIIHLPKLLRNMKEDFSLVEDKVRYLENVDILLIDDIGAESVTAWGRDEILGAILQTRMNNKQTTFFTSNLTISELESHLSITKNSEDLVKSRRIIERIKELTEDLELISVNRRN